MKTKKGESKKKPAGSLRPVLVWDLPTRLFHWALVLLVGFSFLTAKTHRMDYHLLSGYGLLFLLLFRLGWGVWGGRYSRFSVFVSGPGAAWRYARRLLKADSPRFLGHNPMGSWSVLAMLAALLLQVLTGLFANDAVLTEGPLAHWVSQTVSDRLTRVHKINQYVILALIGIHLAAIAFYWFVKGENLVKPMLTGYKPFRGKAESSAGDPRAAALIAILAAAAVYLVVR